MKNKLSFEITNQNHSNKLILTLNTDSTKAQDLFLFVEKNDSVWNPCDDMVLSDDNVKFYIYLNNYEVGDFLTSFEVRSNSSLFPWQTNEGVTILVDGKEAIDSPIHTNMYTTSFNDDGEHTIQAVYTGNNTLNMSMTTVHHFSINQYPVDPTTPVPSSGTYALNFVDKNLKFVYGIPTTVKMILTKNKTPVDGRTVELIPAGSGEPASQVTKNGGIVSMSSSTWSAGKYKIGGYFTDDSKKIVSRYMNITVEKAPVDVTMSTGTFSKGDTIKFYFKSNKKALSKVKVQLYVNGKATDYTTSSSGVISYKFKTKGTYKLKAVYKGDKNHKSGELATTITI